jgi:hypothetical protein
VKKGTQIIPLSGQAELEEESASEWVAIILVDDTRLDCVPEHPIYLEDGKTLAANILPGNYAVTQRGLVAVAEIRRYREEGTKVQVRIPEGKLYWANGILSHNKA